MHKLGPRGSKHYFWQPVLLEKCHIITLSKVDWIHKKLFILFLLSSSLRGSMIGTNITISSEFSSLHVKLWYHMFSSMKMEKNMESELSTFFFWVKLDAKNIVLGSLGDQCRVVSAAWCIFMKKHADVLNHTVRLYCFPYWIVH